MFLKKSAGRRKIYIAAKLFHLGGFWWEVLEFVLPFQPPVVSHFILSAFRRNTRDLICDLSGCFSASSLAMWWSGFPLRFYLCLVKAVSLLNICWPVRRRSSSFRNVKRLFAEPGRCSLCQSLCLSLRQIAASLEDSCRVLKRSVLLCTPSASTARETHRETESRNKTLWEKTFNRSVVTRCLKHTVMKCEGLTFFGFIFRPVISRTHLNLSLRWSLITVSIGSAIDRRLHFMFDIKRSRGGEIKRDKRGDEIHQVHDFSVSHAAGWAAYGNIRWN